MLGFRLEIPALPRRSLVGSALLTASVAVSLKLLGAFQTFDLAMWDVWLRSRATTPERDAQLVLVEITEEDIQKFGAWPLPESTLVDAILKINAGQPRAIGLVSPSSLIVAAGSETGTVDEEPATSNSTTPSIALPTPSPNASAPGDPSPTATTPATTPPTSNSLVDTFTRLPHLVAAFDAGDRTKLPPDISDRQLGAMDLRLDLDGKLRRNLLSMDTAAAQPLASFALNLSLLYLQHEAIESHSLDSERGWFQFGKTKLVPLSPSSGGYVDAQQRGYHIPLLYQLPLRNFPRIALSDLLSGQYAPELFRDRVAILGTVAPRFSYTFETPIDPRADRSNPQRNLPNLWVQAQATQQLLSIALKGEASVATVPDWLEILGVLAWVGLGTWGCDRLVYSWLCRSERSQWSVIVRGAAATAIGGSIATVSVGWGVLAAGIWLPIGGMVAGLWASTLGVVVLQLRNLRQHNEDLTTMLDLTVQHAESVEGQLVRDSERQRYESTLKSQQVLDAVPVGVALFNARGQLEYVNDRARVLFGEAALTRIFDENIGIEDFASACGLYDTRTNKPCGPERLPFVTALQGQKSYSHQLEIRTPPSQDGMSITTFEPDASDDALVVLDRVPIEGWGQPIYSLKGTIQNAIFVFQDTIAQQKAWDERLQFNCELERKNQELQEADRLKDEFLKRTTHELRTPLNGILGSLQLVLDDLCDDRFEERELLNQAHKSAMHLFDIVNDILDFNNIKSGHVVLDLRCVDLHACLTQSLYLQLSSLRQKKLQLIKKYSDEEIAVHVDPIRLKQVFLNTIGNAIKFTEHGSIKISTELDTRVLIDGTTQEVAVIEIEDTGIGVDPAIQPKLFEAFRMEDGSSTRSHSGSGLGLAICRQLLDLMNAAIELKSEGRDRGTTVRICVPLSEQEMVGDAAPTVPALEGTVLEAKLEPLEESGNLPQE